MKKKISVTVLALVLVFAFVSTALAAGPVWMENFDSYTDGQDVHGVNGWKGWFNDPAASALVSSAQSLNAPHSIDINGGSDLVHEYSETTGQWAYRTYQYIPSDMQGLTYFIMLNQYDDAGATNNWSVQTNFDGATGMITDDSSGAQMPFVTDTWAEICVEIDLDADTQIFYYNRVGLYNGVWNGYQSGAGTGANAIGAVDLFANGASPVYYDNMTLTAGSCTVPTDVNLSGFGGSSDAGSMMPLALVGGLLLVGGALFVSRRRQASI